MEIMNVINQLQPQEVAELLINQGVEPAAAEEFGAYYEAQGLIESSNELTTKLRELGTPDTTILNVMTITEEDFEDISVSVNENGGIPAIDDLAFLEEVNFEDGMWFDEDDFPEEPIDFPGEPLKLPQNNRPLVFIPGIMATELIDKRTGKKVWPPVGPDGIESSLKSLNEKIQNGGYKNLEPARSTSLNPYTELLHHLDKKCGYSVDRRNLLIFTYNWMQSNKVTAVQLTKAILKFLAVFNKEFGTSFDKVDVICHSMGGIVTRAAIKLNSAAINKTVYIATPHYGAPKAYFILNPAIDNFGLLSEIAFDILKSDNEFDDLDEAFQTLAASCPAVFELLPDAYYLFKLGVIRRVRLSSPPAFGSQQVFSPVFETTIEIVKGYIQTYFNKNKKWHIANEDLFKEFLKAMSFKFSLGEEIPGTHLILYSNKVKTNDTVKWNGYRFSDVTASGRLGDGTVPAYSGSAGESANSVKIAHKSLTHNQLPNDKRVIKKIEEFLELKRLAESV